MSPPALRGLRLAAREVGARQIQNSGTIGGNLCNASPAADGAPPLLVVDAEVELASASRTRRLSLAEFIDGPRRTKLAEDELLTAIRIPARALSGESAFLKLGARKHLVISIAMVAARIAVDGGIVTEAALAIGSCGPAATRLPYVERALIGAPLDPARITAEAVAASLAPIDDIRGSADYRIAGATELARRAVAMIARAEGAAA